MIALPARTGARQALIAAIIAVAVLGFAAWWIFVRPRAAQVQAAASRVEAATATGTAGAAKDAVKIVTQHDREVERIHTITERGSDAVRQAADAGTPVPAVAAAMRGSLCVFDTYRADAGCPAVPGVGASVGAAEPDAGRGAASGQ